MYRMMLCWDAIVSLHVVYTDVTEAVTSSLNESLTMLLGNDSVTSNITRKTSPTDEYFR